MRISVITLVRGRHAHLAAQREAIARSARLPEHFIIVAMDDPQIETWVPDPRLPPTVINVPATGSALPLAAARNAGAAAALDRGTDLLVFLDVDCLPAPGLIDGYAEAAAAAPDRLLCGPVTYLDPPPDTGYNLRSLQSLDCPHPARPAPNPGEVIPEENPDLFWSLSFAVTAAVWRRIGGFCEDYTGYGGEDTDFARTARSRGTGLAWVGGARAYHQWHPTQDPPVQHLADIVRNANLFYARWGTWPMGGWLQGFRDLGLVEGGTGTRQCVLTERALHPA